MKIERFYFTRFISWYVDIINPWTDSLELAEVEIKNNITKLHKDQIRIHKNHILEKEEDYLLKENNKF